MPPSLQFHAKLFALVLGVLVLGDLTALADTLAVMGAPEGGSPRRTEDSVGMQAGNVLALAKNLQWPEAVFPASDTPLVIAVLDGDEFAEALKVQNKGRLIGGRIVEIRGISDFKSLEKCHVVCAFGVPQGRIRDLLKAAAGKPTLLISDASDFLKDGGHIQFLRIRPNITFGVNLDATTASGLKIQSKIVDYARVIVEQGVTRKR